VRLQTGLAAAFDEAGVEACIPRVGPLLGLFFGSEPPTDFDSAKKICDNGMYQKFFAGMLSRGVAFAPGAYEAVFTSLAHTDVEIDATIEACREVAEEMA